MRSARRTHTNARLAMAGARPTGLGWTDWEQALRRDSLPTKSLAAAVGVAFSQAVLDLLDEREMQMVDAVDPDSDTRRSAYQSLAKSLGVSATTVAQTYLGHRFPTLDDLTLALRHPTLGPRLRQRLSAIEAGLGDDVLSRDQDSDRSGHGGDSASDWITASHVLRDGGGRVLTEQEEIVATAAQAREFVTRMARAQEAGMILDPDTARTDWLAAREILAPTVADTQPSTSPSKAIRATGIGTDLAAAVRRVFAESAELSNRAILKRVNASLPLRSGDDDPIRINEHQINRVLYRLRQRGEIERTKQGVHRATPNLRKE